jgi:hypothetical protein
MATLQLKRGTAARWAELNLVLAAGEPGFVIDENRLKIGDGITAWNDLPYMGENDVINASTHYDFPSIGKENAIYKAESEKMIYQWNPIALKYEVLNSTGSGGVLDIDLINGGNANGID